MRKLTRIAFPGLFLLLAGLGAGAGISGCENTMEGMGDDMEQAGDAVEEAGDKAEDNLQQ